MNRSPLRACLLIPFVLGCFALSPTARAVRPPPDGGYPGQNTAEGTDALIHLHPGIFGTDNTAIGFEALFSSTNSFFNTAIGSQALSSATLSEANTAIGYKALVENTTGGFNTATGQQALGSNTSGFANTAIGTGALFGNTTGEENTASGDDALVSNTTGNRNTANGGLALHSNTVGDNNIALGFSAGFNLTTGSNNIDIGNKGQAGESNTIRIGSGGVQTKTVIAGIRDTTVTGGVAVMIDANGRLGTLTSSARFKDAVRPMDKASEVILALQPVTFHYKHELDPEGIPQFGLVAEDVEKVDPALVARDAEGKVYTVRYEAVNAMLLNEFLKEHRKVQEQEKRIDALTAQLKEQAAQIQKVSDQLETQARAPRVVADNQ